MYSPYLAAARGLKLCRKCDTVKPMEEFPYSKRGGKAYSPCFDCSKKARRDWLARQRAARIPKVRLRTYTAEHDERLAQMHRDGFTSPEVAAALGRSMDSVNWRRRELRLSRFKACYPRVSWGPERIAELRRLRVEGHSYSACASKLKTTRGAIANAVSNYLKDARHDKSLPDMRPADRPAATVSLPTIKHRSPKRQHRSSVADGSGIALRTSERGVVAS